MPPGSLLPAGDDWLKECAGCHTTGFNLEKASKFTSANYKAGKGCLLSN